MTETDWNTPKNGDFARYVERLSALALLPKQAPQPGDHGLDVGMTPSAEPHDAYSDAAAAAVAAARRGMQSNGEMPTGARSQRLGAGFDRQVAVKAVAIAWFAVMAAMVVFNVPFVFVVMVFAGGLWLANRVRSWVLPAGVGNWKQWMEDMARQQQRARRSGQGK